MWPDYAYNVQQAEYAGGCAVVDPQRSAVWSLQLQRGMLRWNLGCGVLLSHPPFLLARRAGDLPLQIDCRYFDDLLLHKPRRVRAYYCVSSWLCLMWQLVYETIVQGSWGLEDPI
jgi:hypothetical protein